MPPTFLLVFSLLALAVISPALLVISAGLCFLERFRYLGQQMLICGVAVALLSGLSCAVLGAIFAPVPGNLWQSLCVVAGSGFSIGSMVRVALAVVGRVLSNYSPRRARALRAA